MCLFYYLHFKITSKYHYFKKVDLKNRTNLDINRIIAHAGQDVCDTLIGLHFFTGYNTVSTFGGRGKIKALKKIISEEAHRAFLQLGSEWNVSETLTTHLERFTFNLYSKEMSTSDINELRYHLCCIKKGEIESHLLSPCLGCLKRHSEREHFQAAICKRSL